MNTNLRSPEPTPIGPLDLFAVLEQAYRRHNLCRACTFSLPQRVARAGERTGWFVIPSSTCSEKCRDLLDELVSRYQSAYRLREA